MRWRDIKDELPEGIQTVLLFRDDLADDCPANPYTVSNADYVRAGNAAKARYTHCAEVVPPVTL